jgi:hypothetical protein
MADLITADGIQYYFDPGQIAAISDHDPSTGDVTTCVFGLSPRGYLRVEESVREFMSRVKLADKFGQLTLADGASIWVNASLVSSIRSRAASDENDVNSVVFVPSGPFFLKDIPSNVSKVLRIFA